MKQKKIFAARTNIRIWEALCLTPAMDRNFSIIKEVLSPRPKVSLPYIACFSREVDRWLTKASDKLLSIALDQSQMDALHAAIRATKSRTSHSVELIWGPPGSGKTNTISAILWVFLHMKCRTLTCAPTNVAVVGVCSHLLQLVKINDRQDGLPSTLADVVLFGNRDQMELDDELEDVFLDSRVDQLVDCFSPTTGWEYKITSLIRLLEDCGSMYDDFLENTNKEEVLTFAEFLRKRLIERVDLLEDCAKSLWIHTNCISLATCSKMVSLVELLERIRDYLRNGDVSDDELRQVFSQDISNFPPTSSIHGSVASELEFSTCKKLSEARVEALHLLKLLQETISVPNTLDRDWIRSFCLRSPLLVFCTASNSSMLHHVYMDPLEVVVIDEAAQQRM